MKICFFAASSLPIHAGSLEERPLGGTETGLIRVSDELASRGHEVFVVTSHPNPIPHNRPGGAVFLPESALRQVVPFDVLVAVQYWKPLFYGIPARRRYLWTGDGYEQFSNFGIGDRRVSTQLEKLLVASHWHADTLSAGSQFPREKMVIVGNGYHPPYFEGEEQRDRQRIIYSSAPYRGLELAAQYFSLIRENFPEAEFHVFAGMSIYERGGAYRGPHAESEKRLASMLRSMPGVVVHGNVLQRQLAREYMKSSIFLYPNIVEETFCITALEAQAAGCPVIASAISALPETVGEGGFVIPGEIGGEEYSKNLILVLGKLLVDDALWSEVSLAGRKRAAEHYTWKRVTDRIEQALQ